MLKNEDISLGQKRFHEQKGKEKFGKASQTGLSTPNSYLLIILFKYFIKIYIEDNSFNLGFY